MRCSEIIPALSKVGINAFQVWECSSPGCDKKFAVLDAVAHPGRHPTEDRVRLFFFCSDACYLSILPPEACYQA